MQRIPAHGKNRVRIQQLGLGHLGAGAGLPQLQAAVRPGSVRVPVQRVLHRPQRGLAPATTVQQPPVRQVQQRARAGRQLGQQRAAAQTPQLQKYQIFLENIFV